MLVTSCRLSWVFISTKVSGPPTNCSVMFVYFHEIWYRILKFVVLYFQNFPIEWFFFSEWHFFSGIKGLLALHPRQPCYLPNDSVYSHGPKAFKWLVLAMIHDLLFKFFLGIVLALALFVPLFACSGCLCVKCTHSYLSLGK